MKIAYILLCHKNPTQINLLISKLSLFESDFYIHIDKKSQMDEGLFSRNNVFVLPKELSIDIRWGEVSMVIATLKIIEMILNSKKRYDYIWLISGQDYPIKSINKMYEYLMKNKGNNFIEVFDEDSKNHIKYSKRNELYYPNWISINNILIKILKRTYIYLTGGFKKTVIFKRNNTTNLKFRYGSQWWTLKYECVEYIYNFLKENSFILKFMRNSIVPDECVFQTVFMASPYAKTRKNNLTYVDLSENKRNPKTFTSSDFNFLIKLEDYFLARKFDLSIDEKIINLINEHIS